MPIKPVISTPLPWLTLFAAKALGRGARKGPQGPRGLGGRGLSRFALPRSLSFTGEGIRFTGLLLLIGAAAINTGNNLLYLVVAMMLSLIIVSGIMSESTLRGLSVRRSLPGASLKGGMQSGAFFKDHPTRVLFEVSNRKKYLPSYSFIIEETPVETGDSGTLSTKPAYVLKLGSASSTATSAEYTFARRGRVSLKGLRIKTRFPFGLFSKGRPLALPAEVIVYPEVRPVKTTPQRRRMKRGSRVPEAEPRGLPGLKGRGTGLYGLREYTFADDSRFIHWRASAKARGLMYKELEEEKEDRVLIDFRNLSTIKKEAKEDAGPKGTEADTYFEAKVDEAASLVNHYILKGYAVGLKTIGAELKPTRGRGQLQHALSVLALVEPSGQGTPTVRVVNL